MKYCKDCIHRTFMSATCKILHKNDLSDHSTRVYGPKMKRKYCYSARHEKGGCGPEGDLWEPKISMWQALKAYFRDR